MSKDLQKTNKSNLNKPKTGKLDLLNINTSALNASLNDLAIPRLFYQLVVFVLDGSGSMTYPGMSGKSKGEEVENAIRLVINRLFNSKNKSSFDLSMWAYANESIQMLHTTPVVSFDLNKNIDPCSFIQKYDGTNLVSTLNSVKVECQNYLRQNKDKNAQALVVVLSDGALDEYEHSLMLCKEINAINNVTVSSIFYESKVWQENYIVRDMEVLKKDMENLASNSSLFTSTLDPEEIRKHMIKSISTVSKID